MYSNLVSAAPLVLTGLLGFLLSPVWASEVPSSGQTIAHLVSSLDANSNVSNASSTDSQPGLGKRSYALLQGKLFTASFNASNGRGGYNISLPGDTCADSVVGSFKTPSGRVIANATFRDIYNATDLPTDELVKDTMTRALALQTKLNTTLEKIICPPQPDRELKFRYDRDSVDGFWSAFILAGIGVAGIGFAGLRTAIVDQSQGVISVNTEVWILSATALAQFIVVTAFFRLQHFKVFSRGEAFVLNLFIMLGEQIAAAAASVWGMTCATPGALQAGLSFLSRTTVGRLQAFEPRSLGTGGASSLDLVGQDLSHGRSPDSSHC